MKLMTHSFVMLFRIAFPLMLSGLAQNSVYFFETMFLSKLGSDVLAAASLVGWLAATFIVVLFGIFGAINVLVAHRYGAKQSGEIALIVRDGLRLAIILALPSIFIYWHMDKVFLILGQDPSILPLAKLYLHALAWGLLPNFIEICFFELLIGLGHSHLIMKLSILTVIVTIVLSYLLIFGYLGLPECGIAGAGWGISIGQWFNLILMIIVFLMNKDRYRIYLDRIFDLKASKYLIEIIQIGLPLGLMYGIEIGFVFVLNLLVGYIGGSLYLAANQIAFQYLGLSMAVIFCISQAITVRMGHLLGAKDFNHVYSVIFLGSLMSAGLTLIFSLFFWFCPQFLIDIDIEVHQKGYQLFSNLASHFLFLCGFYQILEAVRLALFGALRAFHETDYTMWVSLISMWGFALPLGYICAHYTTLATYGLWWGMMAGVALSIIVLVLRLRNKKSEYLVLKN